MSDRRKMNILEQLKAKQRQQPRQKISVARRPAPPKPKPQTTKKVITLAYIGNKFYLESGTRMGSFLEITDDGYERGGLGDVESYVMRGYEVHVQPATAKEMAYAVQELRRVQSLKY
jgi:hypothetical protein